MPKVKRARLALEAERRNAEQLVRLGREVYEARKRRRWTQQQLAERVGLTRPVVSRVEHGLGGGHTLDTWQRIGLALDRPLRVELARDRLEGPADAGHLAIQEVVLRVGRRGSWRPLGVELLTKPSEPWRSADVAFSDQPHRLFVLVECWNTIGDVGASARSTNRKLAELAELAVARFGPDGRAAACWVVRATRRNRALVGRYPELFAARFPASSRRWLEALERGAAPPAEPGLVWASVDGNRLFAWRRR
ncbi:MAG TPA: helix-turn-helix domain-containing protein [Candidatus Limnocylindrales bacterium]